MKIANAPVPLAIPLLKGSLAFTSSVPMNKYPDTAAAKAAKNRIIAKVDVFNF